MSAPRPNRCTGRIARVRGVIARANRVRIAVERHRIDVDEHRRRAEPADAAGRREERIRRRDDFVARADAERHQRDEQRVGARRDGDRVLGLEERRQLALERVDFRAQDEPLAVADARERREELVADRRGIARARSSSGTATSAGRGPSSFGRRTLSG